jgi:hypothetical protein
VTYVLKGAVGRHHPCRRWDVLLDFPRLEAELAYWLKHADRLTHEERRAIIHGNLSVVVRPIEPAWSKDAWLQVASGLDIVVTAVRPVGDIYRTTFNKRDFRPNLMRRTVQVTDPPAFDIYGEPIPPTAAAIKAARIDGGYCQSAALAVPDSAEEVDIESQERFAEAGAVNYRIVHATRVAKQEIKTLSQKLRRVQGEAARKGVDISPDIAEIKRHVEGIESRLSEAA